MSGMARRPRPQVRPTGPARPAGALVVALVLGLGGAAASCSSSGGRGGSSSGDGRPPASARPATTTSSTAPTTTPTTAPPSGTGPPPPSTTAPPARPPHPPALPAGTDTVVERHVDGDTVVVAAGRKVRLIGIDTPETRDPRKPVQCFGREASAFTASLLPVGERVRLVTDVEPVDRYGRTLAYVYRLRDGLFVNAELVRRGYASVYTYPPNVAHADEFVALARTAREAGTGLWGACGGPGVPASGTATGRDGGGGGTGACSPAYPSVCIPPAPPDLDCGDVAARRFAVRPPDPHGFDRDGDGIGCES